MNYRKINSRKAESKLYGDIGTWFVNSNTFTDMLDELEAKGFEELIIRLHCYGGSVFDGNVMYNALQRTKLKVTIIIDGIAASMGCMILPAVEEVHISDNGFGMLHRPSAWSGGDADDYLNTAKLLQDMEDNFIKRLHERSRLPEDDIKIKWFDSKDHWLNANEMVELGLAKKVVPSAAKNIKALDKETVIQSKVEDIYGKYAAHLDASFNNKNGKKKMDLVTLLVAALQLEGITSDSSEADVLAAVQKKFNTLTERITTLENEATASLDGAIDAILDDAQASGKIIATAGKKVEDVRAAYKKIGQANGVEVLTTILGGIQKPTSIVSQLNQESKDGEPPKDFEELLTKGEDFIAQFLKEQPDMYKKLYKAEFGHDPVTL